MSLVCQVLIPTANAVRIFDAMEDAPKDADLFFERLVRHLLLGRNTHPKIIERRFDLQELRAQNVLRLL